MARHTFSVYDIYVDECNAPSDTVFQYALYSVRQKRNRGRNTECGGKLWSCASVLRVRLCCAESRLADRYYDMDSNDGAWNSRVHNNRIPRKQI